MKNVELDFEQLNTLKFLEINTEEEIISSLLQIFSGQYKEICQQISDCVVKNEFYDASRLSHKLKSSALQLGMKDVAKACLFLEIELKNKNHHNYQLILEDLTESSEFSIMAVYDFINLNNNDHLAA